MKITISTIPHKNQRYKTVGDWSFDPSGDFLQIYVSDMGNADYETLVALHEVTEAILCKKRGIDGKDVTKFDKIFEEARESYPEIFGDTEPGDHPRAPYNAEHAFASRLEHSVAMELGIDWQAFNQAVNEL